MLSYDQRENSLWLPSKLINKLIYTLYPGKYEPLAISVGNPFSSGHCVSIIMDGINKLNVQLINQHSSFVHRVKSRINQSINLLSKRKLY